MMLPAAAQMRKVTLTSLLVVLVLMGTANSKSVCGKNCHLAKYSDNSCFRHVSELKDSSISSWTLKKRPETELAHIEQAVCNNCSDINLVAKPINIEIYVFHQVRNGTEHHWCRCPIEVPVGCTCVRK